MPGSHRGLPYKQPVVQATGGHGGPPLPV